VTNLVRDLLEHLSLEQLEDNLFRGGSRKLGGKSIFGGQVLGQALVAADQTIEGRLAHSLHAYFLRPGDPDLSVIYKVERLRDGRSFTTRRVTAIQRERPIFAMAISFQISEEGFEHQMTMPDVPGPEGLLSTVELRRQFSKKLPETLREVLTAERPIELRPVVADDPLHTAPRPPAQAVWLRAGSPLPEQPSLHQALLAYASDFNLLDTALLPHGISFFQPEVQAASLDHAMWFHRPFRMDDWLLYSMDSPSACGNRGLARGNIFSADGRLVASVAQEGLIRRRENIEGR